MDEDLTAMAAALRDVPGVDAAEVDADAPSTLHVALDPSADGRAVAEAVSRLLHDGPDEPEQPPAVPPLPSQRRPRPGIVRVDLAATDLEARAHVVLAAPDRTAAGDATSTATWRGHHRAVAAATVVAVEELVGGRVRIELDHVDVATYGPDRTALVGLTLVTGSGAERLSGSAVVREDECRAVVRAVLDALNRRIEDLLP